MQLVHIRAVWNHKISRFSFKFNENIWEIESDKFLKMIEDGERQLLMHDGQNVRKKGRFRECSVSLEFVTVQDGDISIDFESKDNSRFVELVAYLRKVYDSWKVKV